jgi:hypothetical protein
MVLKGHHVRNKIVPLSDFRLLEQDHVSTVRKSNLAALFSIDFFSVFTIPRFFFAAVRRIYGVAGCVNSVLFRVGGVQ